jgi:hypothetical protein
VQDECVGGGGPRACVKHGWGIWLCCFLTELSPSSDRERARLERAGGGEAVKGFSKLRW